MPSGRSAHGRWLAGAAGLCAAAVAVCLAPAPLSAQLPQTRLLVLFPPGGQAGQSVDVTIAAGADLDEVDRLHFSHPGIKAVQKTAEQNGRPVPVANQFTVSIDANVPPGMYEVRAQGLFGVSNPRTFSVGALPELNEQEANDSAEQAATVQIGQLINAQSNAAADVDFFKFSGRAGQRVIATCYAARIDSRMKPALSLLDASGNRLAYSREELDDDPLVDIALPADGEYFLKVHDFTYRGGNEYFYRLSVHSGPHLDFVLPPAGLPGSHGQYTLFGRNLPGGQPAGISIDGRPLDKLDVPIPLPQDPIALGSAGRVSPPAAGIDAVWYTLDAPGGKSNPLLVHLAAAPIALEQEPNDRPAQVQRITVPAEFCGQFQSRGDVDLVEFEAKAGEVYYVEAFGERLGNTADPYFVLDQVTKSEQGVETLRRITVQDDNPTNLAQNIFETPSSDPVFRFQVPADGVFRVGIRDRYFAARGDPRLVYRLSIRREQPDFRLVVVPFQAGQNNVIQPAGIALRKGENVDVRVLAFRRDGYDGTIEVSAEGLPAGVECKGAAIGPGQSSADLIFSTTEDAAEWFGTIQVVGKGRLEDAEKVRAADAARRAVKPLQDALPKLVQDAEAAAKGAEAARIAVADAEQKSKDKPDDEGLKKQLQEAQAKLTAAEDAARKANEAKAAGEKALADAQAAAAAAEQARQAAARELVRPARAGTVVWNGDQNTPPVARLSDGVTLCVMKEKAPYQVTTQAFRFEARPSYQILIPVQLAKRDGFDNNVNLTVTGLPNNAQIQVQNKPIPKGKDSELLRLFVNNNAPPGTYTVYLRTQAQVKHSRNPALVERLKAQQAELAAAAGAAAEAARLAVQARDAAVKQAADAAQAVKTAEAEQARLTQQNKAAEEALKRAAEARLAAEKAAAAAETDAKAAQAKAEEAKKASEAAPDNKELADARAAAEKAAAEVAAKAATAAKTSDEAAKKFAEAEAAAKKVADDLAAAQKALADAQAAAKAADDARTKAEQAVKETDDKSKAAQAAKTAIDNSLKAASDAANPKDFNVTPPSTPIIITVKPAPVQLTAAVPGGGNLKRGEKLEVKATVRRVNDFAGPVTLTLPLPPDVTGLSAEAVTIPADQTEGVLTIVAAPDATVGQSPNLVIRATCEFDGEASVDAPITVRVNQ